MSNRRSKLGSSIIIYFVLMVSLLISSQAYSEIDDGALTTIISYLINEESSDNSLLCEAVTGPQRVVEAEVTNATPRYNSSTSSPIASHGDFVYWIYAGSDNPDNPTQRYMELVQTRIPSTRVNGPYPQVSRRFINQIESDDHELRVLDEFDATIVGNANLSADPNHACMVMIGITAYLLSLT